MNSDTHRTVRSAGVERPRDPRATPAATDVSVTLPMVTLECFHTVNSPPRTRRGAPGRNRTRTPLSRT
ncbi:hypothetical protein FAIPA1_250039 [Frankia sp. AiPs1]